MVLFISVLLAIVITWICCIDAQDVMPATLKVAAGDSLYLSWQAESGPLTSCSALTPWGETVSLGTSGRLTYWGAGLAQGVCGMKADTLQIGKDNGTWILVATGETTSRRTTNVTIIDFPAEGPSRNVSVQIENYLMVQCGPVDEVLYCELTSPTNETSVLRLTKCRLEIFTTSPDIGRFGYQRYMTGFTVEFQHAGSWECRYLQQYQTYETHAVTTVNVITNTVNFEVGQNETETELNIFCNHPVKPIEKIALCSLVPPNGRERIVLAPGMGLSRYRYYGFASFHCGVAISKPLLVADFGAWRCEMIYYSQSHKGGYVYVTNDTQVAEPIKPLKGKTTVKVIVSGKLPLVVSCAVPTSLVYCWLQHPNGTVFSVSPSQSYSKYKYFGQGYDFGECGISIASPAVNDTGRWICGMGLLQPRDGVDSQEVTTSVNVVVSDSPLVVVKPERDVRKGDELVVGCAMLIPQAINYCRFWKPDHTGLTISNVHNLNVTSKDRYQYAGDGLFVGDCRLRIRNVASSDLGRWLCATTPAYILQGRELIVTFDILQHSEDLVSVAAGFGIAAGVIVVVVVIIAAVMYHYRGKLKARSSAESLSDHTRLDEIESETGSSYETATRAPINISRKRVIFNRRSQIS